MAGSTIYNSTDGPLIVDDEGRTLGGRERLDGADPSSSPIAGHIEAGRIVVVDTPQAQADEDADDTTPTKSRTKRGTTTQQEG